MDNRKPNFIFVMTDEQNLRGLSCYKGTVCQTPTVDRMASEGVLFENACCTNPMCMPSRGVFMSGRYSHTTGLRINGQTLPQAELPLPEIFKSEGYATGLCGKDHCFRLDQRQRIFDECSVTAMHMGIIDELSDEFSEMDRAAQKYYQNKLRDEVFAPFGNATIPFPGENCDAGVITTAAVNFIEKNRNNPFFLWLSYPGPHWPFACPEEYADFVPPEMVDMPPQGESGNKPLHQELTRRLLAADKAEEKDFRKVISRYYGSCRYIDDQIARVFKMLAELGIDEDTIVFFTSDHGDYLGEHRLMHKSRSVYDCLMMVPFIFRWPGHIESGQRRAEFADNADLLPTVLDLCGIEIPPAVQGISHAQALLGNEPYHDREAIFGEHGAEGSPYTEEDFKSAQLPENPYSTAPSDWVNGPPGFYCGRIKMVRTHKWKFGYYPEKTHELYDLENDPWELHNLYGNPEYNEVVAELMEKLLEWEVTTENTAPPLAQFTPLKRVVSKKYLWNHQKSRWEIRDSKAARKVKKTVKVEV